MSWLKLYAKGPRNPATKHQAISTWLCRLGFRQPKLNSKASLPHKPGDGTPFSHPWNALAGPALGCHQVRSIGPTALFGAASSGAGRASGRRRSKDWWCGKRQSGPRNESPFPGSEPRNLRRVAKNWLKKNGIPSTEWDSYEDVTTGLSTLTLTPSNFWQFFRAADVWWEVLAAEAKGLLEGRSQAHDKVYELRVLGQLHNLRVAFHTTLQGLPQTNSKASTCTLSHHVVGHLWEVRVAIVVVASSHHTHLLQVPSISFRVNTPVGIGMHLGMINIDDVVG